MTGVLKSQLTRVAGEEQFEAVVRDYQDKVFRLCYAMLGSRALAQETAQDVFLRIWKALPRYRGDSSLSTWIYAITRNTCLTSLRKQFGKKQSGRRDDSLDVPSVRRAAESKSSHAEATDRGPDVLRMVQGLPERYRQVVLLYYMEEKSYEEVAAMLDLPLGTVKTYLHRARKELAANMGAISGADLKENKA